MQRHFDNHSSAADADDDDEDDDDDAIDDNPVHLFPTEKHCCFIHCYLYLIWVYFILSPNTHYMLKPPKMASSQESTNNLPEPRCCCVI
jgi:hypothetical protein